jgi:predicted MPP superfamily phosphohydrolase
MSPLTLLHISDFHYSKAREYDQSVVVGALIKDISALCERSHRPDFIVMSGDLVKAADDDRVYDYAFDHLIQPVSKAAGCAESRILLVPGNHDVHRRPIETKLEEHEAFLTPLSNRDALNDAYLSGAVSDYAAKQSAAYFELKQYLYAEPPLYSDPLVTVRHFPSLNVTALEFNTAWASHAGVKNIRDERKLLLPEACIVNALAKVPAGSIVVSVCHHPTNWLTEFSETDALQVLDGQTNFMLFGHMHEPRPASIGTFKGSCLWNQAGALYSGRQRYLGYSMLRYDPPSQNLAVHFRSYFDRRREFGAAVDLTDDGMFYAPPTAKGAFFQLDRRVDRTELRGWLESALRPALTTEFNEGLTDRKTSELFVAPPLYGYVPIDEEEENGATTEVSVEFDRLVAANANMIFSGGAEYGKTTLLQQFALRAIEQSENEGCEPTVAVVIPFGAIKKGESRIRASIRSALPDFPDGCQLDRLLTEGLVTLLVDDVVFNDEVRYPALREFINLYPKNRYVFSATAGRNERYLAPDDPSLVVTFDRITMRPMRRTDMRNLVRKWDPDGRLNQDEVLDRVINEIRSINVPITAVNGTILLTIFEHQSDFTPINRTVLIEQFIEVLLEKRSPQQIERRQFDFTNRTHYLCHIAEHMARSDRYILPRTDLVALTAKYLDRLGLAKASETVVDELLTARIFGLRGDGTISFRYRAFLEFFIAKQMVASRGFRDWVLEDGRYLSYVNEIQYYAGIGRDDQELLETIGQRFAELMAKLFSDLGREPDLKAIETFALPSADASTDDLLAEVEHQINAPPLTPEERDEILEADLPQDVEGRQEVFRPQPNDSGARWFTALLMYSGVVRNLELVPDESKRKHLAAVLRAWSSLLVMTLWVVPQLARQRGMKLNGVNYNVMVSKHLSEGEVARIVYRELPTAISKLLWIAVGTEKLERQLSEPELSEAEEPKLISFFRHTLSIDLRLGDWPGRIDRFTEAIRHSRFLLEGLMVKTTEVLRLGSHSDHVRDHLRRSLAEMLGTIKGLPKADRQKFVERHLRNMEQKDMVRRLRAIHDDKRTDAD